MKLNELKGNQKARKARQRVGRGVASGRGKTAGRGTKGQKSRSGVALKGFEGGQMPIHMRLPKRGFNKPNRRKLNGVNLGRLQEAIDAGRLDEKSIVNAAALKAAGIIRRELDGVRILGTGELKTKLDFEVAGASASAKAMIEKCGGKLTLLSPKPIETPKQGDKTKAQEAEVKETLETQTQEAGAQDTGSPDTSAQDTGSPDTDAPDKPTQ